MVVFCNFAKKVPCLYQGKVIFFPTITGLSIGSEPAEDALPYKKGLFLFIFIPEILTNRERSFDISNGMPPIFRCVH